MAMSLKRLAKALLPPVIVWVASRLLHLLRPSDEGARPLPLVEDVRAGLSRVTWTDGSQIMLRHRGTPADLEVIRQIFRGRDYDLGRLARGPDLVAFYETCRDPIVVDCGANIGASPIWFNKSFPRATVVAIEPESSNMALLKANAAPMGAIHPVLAAVSHSEGFVRLIDPGLGAWGYRTASTQNRDGDVVRAVTLPGIVREYGGTPFILKIDIEGAESDLFSSSGSGDSFDRFPLVIIELHDWLLPGEASSRSFLQWHAQRNRDFVYLAENVFSVSNEIARSSQAPGG